jgi:hypothetical protein
MLLEEIFIADDGDENASQETYREEPRTLRANRKRATAAAQERVTGDIKPCPSWFRRNLHAIGLGMVVMALLFLVCVSSVIPVYTRIVDRWDTGQARISHVDLDAGHNGTSHFIAEYYHGQALIIELPPGHPEQAKTYALRMAATGDSEPRIVTLHTAYINPDGKPGYPDLVVQVEGFGLPEVLYNTGNGFSQQ